MKSPRAVVALALLSLWSVSCSHRPIGGTAMADDDVRTKDRGPVFADPSLDGDLEVGTVQASRVPGAGKLRLQIPLHNVSGAYLPLLVRVVFKDDAGQVLLGDETPWENVGVPVGTHYHSVTSLKELATRYEVHIRRYKP